MTLLKHGIKSCIGYVHPKIRHFKEIDKKFRGTEEVLVDIHGAQVYLVEGTKTLVLAKGDFKVVRLKQGDASIALLVKVGKHMMWPLAKDEPVVKLDTCHYLFCLKPPPSHSSHQENEKEVLSYGVTFPSNDKLHLLDEILQKYSCLSLPKGKGRDNKDETIKESQYWAHLAPKVDDYNSWIAKAIATGSGQIIRGIFMCKDAYASQISMGANYMRSTKDEQAPRPVSRPGFLFNPTTRHSVKRVKKLSKMTEKMSDAVLSGVVGVTSAVSAPILASGAFQRFFSMMPGEVLLASADAFNKVLEAAEMAGKDAMLATSLTLSGIVSERYGEEAGEVTGEALEAATHAVGTVFNVIKLKKALNPASHAKPSSSLLTNVIKPK